LQRFVFGREFILLRLQLIFSLFSLVDSLIENRLQSKYEGHR
jgi:hypothetical protein